MVSTLLSALRLRRTRSSARVYTAPAEDNHEASFSHPSTSYDLQADLALRLAELAAPLGAHGAPSSALNLRWLSTALASLLSTQASLQQVLAHADASTLDRRVMEQYLDEGASLLDVCNVLRDVIRQDVRATSALQLALSHLHHATTADPHPFSVPHTAALLRRATHALSAATPTTTGRSTCSSTPQATCVSMLRTIKRKLSTLPSSSDLPLAIYGGHISTLLVFKVLSSALSFDQGPIKKASRCGKISGQPLWEAPLLHLHDKLERLAGAKKATAGVLPELHSLDTSITMLHEMLSTTMENLRHDGEPLGHLLLAKEKAFIDFVRSTTKSAHELHGSFSSLQKQMDSLFDALLASRMALLDSLHSMAI